MNRSEQLREMLGQKVVVICTGGCTGFKTHIDGILREHQGIFELWRSNAASPHYRFVPEAITSITWVEGYYPALFTQVCEKALTS